MKKSALFATLFLAAGSLLAGDLKNDITNAAKKLADADNYSWKQTTENAGGGGRFGGPIEGKIQKDGLTHLSITMGDNEMEMVIKGDKGAFNGEDGWTSFAEAAQDNTGGGGGGGRGMFIARMGKNFKSPAVMAQDIAGKVKELKETDGVIAGDFTDEAAKELLIPAFMRRAGGNGPEVSGAKGSAKFWLKDGAIVKFQTKLSGKVTFNDNERDVDRTTTVEIKDVGTTKVTVPEEAKKKMS